MNETSHDRPACYSGWYGLTSYAQQLRVAAARASFYLWSVIALQLASFVVISSLVRLRYTDLSPFLKYGARLVASVAITIAGTALFVWLLSWIRVLHIR